LVCGGRKNPEATLNISLMRALGRCPIEYNHFLAGMARVRGSYRTLTPEATNYFAAEGGRWPEARKTPAMRLGSFIAFITTIASMVAFINSIVAGAGIALRATALAATRLVSP
jgi:hypothetical protein